MLFSNRGETVRMDHFKEIEIALVHIFSHIGSKKGRAMVDTNIRIDRKGLTILKYNTPPILIPGVANKSCLRQQFCVKHTFYL